VITTAHIRAFRCVKDVELTLGPLTVFVGPNASGKTAILEALRPGGFGADDRWQLRVDHGAGVTVIHDNGARSRWQVQSSMLEGGYHWQRLRLDLGPMRQHVQVQAAPQLAEDGANIANVFATLSRAEQGAVAAQLARLIPVLADVGVRPSASGHHRLVFQDRWKQDLWFEPSQVSDGTLLTLAFLLLPYQSAPVDLIVVEEPERGLHPYLLGELVSLMRSLAEGGVGRHPIQIAMATQSPELLEHLRPEEVRFLARDRADGAVRVVAAPVDAPDWKAAYHEYQSSLGSMWLSGSLGGVPGQ
jgi:predicted ATPase